MPEINTIVSKSNNSPSIFIATTAIILFIFGLFLVISFNVLRLTNFVEGNFTLSVIIKDTVKEGDAIFFQKELEHQSYVSSTHYISKEQAAKDLQEDIGENFISFLGYNPLPAAIDVHLNPEFITTDSLAFIKKHLLADQRVKDVFYQQPLIKATISFIEGINNLVLIVSFIIFALVAILLRNVVKMNITSKKTEIKEKIAAGSSIISLRSSYGIGGLFQGFIAAAISIVALFMIVQIGNLLMPGDFEIKYQLIVFGIIMVVGLSICFIISNKSVKSISKSIN